MTILSTAMCVIFLYPIDPAVDISQSSNKSIDFTDNAIVNINKP